MKIRRMVNYTVESKGKWANLSAALMGIAFFLRAFYYFIVKDLTACSTAEVLFCMILPLLLAFLWICAIRILPLKQSMIYGVLAAATFVLLAIEGFFAGSVLLSVLGLLWFLLAAAVCVFVSFGYLPYRIAVLAVGILPAVLRIFIALGTYILPGNHMHGLMEYAAILTLLSLSCFACMLKSE